MLPRAGLLKPDPVWNRLGPPIPLWFRRQLRWIDKDLMLQFVPPRGYISERGVNPEIHPYGVWNIGKLLPRTRFLNPCVVWSLTDMYGRYSPPQPATIKLIRTAYNLQCHNRIHELERLLDESLVQINRAREDRSVAKLRDAIQKYCSVTMGRQWENRVLFGRKVKVA